MFELSICSVSLICLTESDLIYEVCSRERSASTLKKSSERKAAESVISSGVQWSPFVSICMRRLVQLSVETWRCNDRLSQHSEGGLHTPHTQINPCQSCWQPVIPHTLPSCSTRLNGTRGGLNL